MMMKLRELSNLLKANSSSNKALEEKIVKEIQEKKKLLEIEMSYLMKRLSIY